MAFTNRSEEAVMATVPERLVKRGASFEQTNRPVLHFVGWKVAMLGYTNASPLPSRRCRAGRS
jgi:hypothetical protein